MNGKDGNANIQLYTYSLRDTVWTTVGSMKKTAEKPLSIAPERIRELQANPLK